MFALPEVPSSYPNIILPGTRKTGKEHLASFWVKARSRERKWGGEGGLPLVRVLGWSKAPSRHLVPSYLGTILTESKSHLETVQVKINKEPCCEDLKDYELCLLSKGSTRQSSSYELI